MRKGFWTEGVLVSESEASARDKPVGAIFALNEPSSRERKMSSGVCPPLITRSLRWFQVK
jgi:hypothetical protein